MSRLKAPPFSAPFSNMKAQNMKYIPIQVSFSNSRPGDHVVVKRYFCAASSSHHAEFPWWEIYIPLSWSPPGEVATAAMYLSSQPWKIMLSLPNIVIIHMSNKKKAFAEGVK